MDSFKASLDYMRIYLQKKKKHQKMLLGLEPTHPSTVHSPCALGTNKEPRGSLAHVIDGKQASGISLLRINLSCTPVPASGGLSHQQEL